MLLLSSHASAYNAWSVDRRASHALASTSGAPQSQHLYMHLNAAPTASLRRSRRRGAACPPFSAAPVLLTSQQQAVAKSTPTQMRTQDELFPIFVALEREALSGSDEEALKAGLKALKLLGVSGISLDIHWGAVEAAGPQQYQWASYQQLLRLICDMGFQVKVSLCMCACATIPLPQWVLDIGHATPDIWYTDKQGHRCQECLSLGVDELPLLAGRTGVEVYTDFMSAFRQEFGGWLGSHITEVLIGLGPGGELRYPSHPAERWEYPGTGEFQCYDKFMLATLKACAEQVKQPPWGLGGPHDACRYKEWPHQCGFFSQGGSWNAAYGRFFLQWYSEMLARHASLVMGAAAEVFRDLPIQLSARVPGSYWWFGSPSHAAELTTGYFHTSQREGYLPALGVFTSHGVSVRLTMAEARAADKPASHQAEPERLLLAQRTVAAALHVPVTVENSDVRFDEAALARMEATLFDQATHLGIEVPAVQALVINRMTDAMFEPYNWQRFKHFVRKVRDRADLMAYAPNAPSMDEEADRRIGSSQQLVHRG